MVRLVLCAMAAAWCLLAAPGQVLHAEWWDGVAPVAHESFDAANLPADGYATGQPVPAPEPPMIVMLISGGVLASACFRFRPRKKKKTAR